MNLLCILYVFGCIVADFGVFHWLRNVGQKCYSFALKEIGLPVGRSLEFE
jgi:hypothetical protein